MKRIVVFDYGWGGELVANFLAQELAVVEVIRVIDWGNALDYCSTVDEMLELAKENLKCYIGAVDLIVLGGYTVSCLYDVFVKLFPEQKFVRMSINAEQVFGARSCVEKIAVLGEPFVLSRMKEELLQVLGRSILVLPDCAGWESLIDHDLANRDFLRAELSWDFELCGRHTASRKSVESKDRKMLDYYMKDESSSHSSRSSVCRSDVDNSLLGAVRRLQKVATETKREEEQWILSRAPETSEMAQRAKIRPDIVVLLSTHFWAVKDDLEALFGWRTRVVDFREKLLRDVCMALKLRGVDGKRAKR